MSQQNFIIGVSGASGVIYGIRLLEILKQTAPGIKTILVISPSAEKNVEIETDYSVEQVKALAGRVEEHSDLAASISSGSYKTMGMAVVPCSIRTLSDIANANANNLLSRAADVTLKEGRKLVIVPRETPLHKVHLELMIKVCDIGGVILPPFPAFYHHPESVEDVIDHTVGKVLDQFGVEHDLFKRWEGEQAL